MAKSANYFGLRKGSTKSHTFSVVDGKQITKDRVEGCKNFDDICTIALIYPKKNGSYGFGAVRFTYRRGASVLESFHVEVCGDVVAATPTYPVGKERFLNGGEEQTAENPSPNSPAGEGNNPNGNDNGNQQGNVFYLRH